MKRSAFAFAVLALGLTAAAPARADYTVVRWENGYCQIWWDSSATPWGVGWTKIAVTPDWSMAADAKDSAIQNGACR
jgi:hypothetical protein